MPWTKRDVPRFRKDLTDREKELWVSTANRVLGECKARNGGEKCEALAIKVANASVRDHAIAHMIDDGMLVLEAVTIADIQYEEVPT